MKITEILTEAQMSPEIKKIMGDKGYKYISRGQDQDVYLSPDGTILKIFGWDRDKGSSGFTRAQGSFIAFANYCKKNPNNQFLPDFSDWATFEFDGKTYLQIKTERLFPLSGDWEYLGNELGIFVDSYIERYGATEGLKVYIDKFEGSQIRSRDQASLIIMMLGKDGLTLFAKTVDDLSKIAKQKGYGLDLHSGNFMFGSDSHLVINDPFFTGSFRGLT